MIYPIQLVQKTRYAFLVKWSDGKQTEYTLPFLQKNCLCRNCTAIEKREVDPLVMADEIETIGKYALKIKFTSGCNHGIFPFDYLLELASQEESCVHFF